MKRTPPGFAGTSATVKCATILLFDKFSYLKRRFLYFNMALISSWCYFSVKNWLLFTLYMSYIDTWSIREFLCYNRSIYICWLKMYIVSVFLHIWNWIFVTMLVILCFLSITFKTVFLCDFHLTNSWFFCISTYTITL